MRRPARTLIGGRGPRVDRAEHEALVARLQAERDHYSRVLAAATGDAIFTTGTDGVITFFNGGAERLLGYSADDVVGRMRGLDLHLPEEIDAAARELGVEPGRAVFLALAGRGAESREWTFVRSDGSHVRVAHTVTTLRDEHGEIVGLAHDITARHRGERREEAIVRAIIATADALEAAVVAEGIETEGQRAALRDLGVRSGQGYLFARPMPARMVAAAREAA
jgi:PAS domain S-box-containing protein